MKTLTLNPKTILILLVITLFSVSIFAKGLSFRVKVYNVDKQTISASLSEPINLFAMEDGVEVGDFENYLVAMKLQYQIEDLGFSNTKVVSYFNQTEIPLDDAFTLLDNRNKQDENMVKPMSESEMELALKMVQNEQFYYSIQIGVFSEEAVNKFFDFPKKIDESITPKGYYRYTYGRFYTLQDAKDALVMLQENYFETAFIVAFDELERIPITAAIDKEKRLLEESIAAVNP